jgi:hypothetical protein
MNNGDTPMRTFETVKAEYDMVERMRQVAQSQIAQNDLKRLADELFAEMIAVMVS